MVLGDIQIGRVHAHANYSVFCVKPEQTRAIMVEWTQQERSIITGIFSNLDYEEIGAKALSRYGCEMKNEMHEC